VITGAGRGMDVDVGKAALAAGYAVVATGRRPETVAQAVGAADDLLTVRLDVTDPASAQAAVRAAVDRFGRIDVLVNNAGTFIAGFFEEITPDDFRAQIETNLFGPLNVARAVLPVMRAQRSGLVMTISSTAGIAGGEFTSAYAASKFALEGWMEPLAPEAAPYGIRTMLVVRPQAACRCRGLGAVAEGVHLVAAPAYPDPPCHPQVARRRRWPGRERSC
jgi:NAD(P)-dependent dehydrogenase (short-subunit alcohol dehydrogenase family)